MGSGRKDKENNNSQKEIFFLEKSVKTHTASHNLVTGYQDDQSLTEEAKSLVV